MSAALPRTMVYVDGYNLYYAVGKKQAHKWLDILAVAKRLLPNHDIVGLKYFTAMVSGADDPKSPIRQQTFLRALKASGNVEVVLGLFASHNVWRPLSIPDVPDPRRNHQFFCKNGRICVQVLDTKEKGSDVNLAAHLITDAWLDRYDVAVIMSNDSDLATAISLVKQHKSKVIGVINPSRKRKLTAELLGLADFNHVIRLHDLVACQFPSTIPGTDITKPIEW